MFTISVFGIPTKNVAGPLSCMANHMANFPNSMPCCLQYSPANWPCFLVFSLATCQLNAPWFVSNPNAWLAAQMTPKPCSYVNLERLIQLWLLLVLEIDKKTYFLKNNNKIRLPKRMEGIQVVIRQALYSANMPKLSKIHIDWYENIWLWILFFFHYKISLVTYIESSRRFWNNLFELIQWIGRYTDKFDFSLCTHFF